MKRLIAVLTVLLVSAAVTGCSAAKAIHDKKYLRAVSVYGDEEKNAVFFFYTDEEDRVNASGDSIDSARKAAELECGNEIVTGHTELVILGSCDYKETLIFLLNEWRVSPSCIIAYCEDADMAALESGDAEVLADSIKTAQEQGKAPQSDIITVLSGLLSGNGSAEVVCLDGNGVSGEYTLKVT